MLKTTLCYIERGNEVLMLYRNKKKNDLNEGKWIGIGGKLEPGESADDCVRREVKEETGFAPDAFTFHGVIHFHSEKEDEDMFLYTAAVPAGSEPSVCGEGTLAWIRKQDIFSLSLWEGDRLFLERLTEKDASMELSLWYEGDRLVRWADKKNFQGL